MTRDIIPFPAPWLTSLFQKETYSPASLPCSGWTIPMGSPAIWLPVESDSGRHQQEMEERRKRSRCCAPASSHQGTLGWPCPSKGFPPLPTFLLSRFKEPHSVFAWARWQSLTSTSSWGNSCDVWSPLPSFIRSPLFEPSWF